MKTSFTEQEMKSFKPAEKIGLVACVNPEGLPHISLITSIMAPKPDQLTLVFAKKDGKWAGTFSDTQGYASEAECEEIKIDGRTVTLHFDISDGYETQTIYVTLNVEGDSMTGAWENEGGEGAEIKLEKKK